MNKVCLKHIYNFVVNSVPADIVALLGAMPFASKTSFDMLKFWKANSY